MTVVLDAGAFIAVERADPKVGAMLRVAQQEGLRVRASAAAVAQVWRADPRQAHLARVLAGVHVLPLDGASARRIGALLASDQSSDVVDAHVATLATAGGRVLTSDPKDLDRLIGLLGTDALVVKV